MYSCIRSVDIKLLYIFETVAKHGGFSAAQDELSMSQSTISTYMSDLEARLGYRLCERGRKGFYLTEEGQRILQYTRRLFAELEAFVGDVRNLSGRLFGELQIGVLDSTLTNENAHVVEGLRRFYQRNQDVRLQLCIKSPTDLEEGVLNGQLHAAISYVGRRLTNIEYVDLFKERMSIYCGRKHPLFGAKTITTEDLMSCNWIKRGYLMPSDLVPITPSHFTATAHQMEAVALLILAGAHIGYLPQHYARQWVEKGDMFLVKGDLTYEVSHCLLLNRGRAQNRALDVFVSDIVGGHGAVPSSVEPLAPVSLEKERYASDRQQQTAVAY